MSHLKLDQWFGDTDPRALPQLLAVLQNSDFRPSDTGLTSRTLQRWEAEDLIVCSREKSGNWRAFNYPEFVWLMMVKKMRDLGIPYLLIKSVKNQLFGAVLIENDQQTPPATPFSTALNTQERAIQGEREGTHGEPYRVQGSFPYTMLIEGLIARCVRFRGFCHLQIFPDLGAFPVCYDEGDFTFPAAPPERIGHGGFFTVPVSAIVAEYLLESGAIFEPVKEARLSETDAAIFDIIQSGVYEKVIITFDQAKPISLEAVQVHTTDTSIGEVLEGGDDLDLNVRKSKGRITRIEHRVTVPLTKTQTDNQIK